MAAIFPAPKIVRGNTTKPRDAEFTGRYHRDQPIYAEAEPVFEQRVVKDDAGEIIYELNRDGTRKRPKVKAVVKGHRTREFILEDLGNGVVSKNYAFKPDPAEVERQRAQEATAPEALAAFVDKVNRVFEKMGLSEEDIEALASDEDEEENGAKGGKKGK
jgi:hypothetical protein